MPSQKEAEAEVRSWGFKHVFTWSDGPVSTHQPRIAQQRLTLHQGAYYSPHTHSGLTTHLVLAGKMTIRYPDDASPQKETFGPGSRIDVDARRRHEVWMDEDEGAKYVIGE